MHTGGRPQNSTWNFILHVPVGNKKYAKSVIIGNNSNAARVQVHYTKCSMDPVSSASIQRIFSNFGNIHTKVSTLLGNSKLLSWYSATGFSEEVLS